MVEWCAITKHVTRLVNRLNGRSYSRRRSLVAENSDVLLETTLSLRIREKFNKHIREESSRNQRLDRYNKTDFNEEKDICSYESRNYEDYNLGITNPLEITNSPNRTIDRTSSSLIPSSWSAAFSIPGPLLQPPFIATVPPLMQPIGVPPPFGNINANNMVHRHILGTTNVMSVHRRPRSEKKPIPDDQKDEKYYERRKRNNQAAKKSRDARKIREDHIALRATMLEHENAILRAQVITLREEAQCLRHMLIKQQPPSLQSVDCSIPSVTPVTLSSPHSTSTLDCQI